MATAMSTLELPLRAEEYRRKALNQESFRVDVDSLQPHPALKELMVPLPADAYERLYESIKLYGIRVPLHIWIPPGTNRTFILDGHHRWKVAKDLGLKHVPVLVLDLQDDLEARIWIVRANLDRRQLTPGQRAMLARTLYELEKEKARARQVALLKKGQEKPTLPVSENFRSRGEKGKAADLAARQAGISGRTLEKAMKAVEARPELAEKLKRGEISVDQAYRIAKGKDKDKDGRPAAEEKKPVMARVPTVGPQVVVTLPRQHFEWLCELAQKWELKPKELASHGLMEWLAAQNLNVEEPRICVRLPLKNYRVLEKLCRPVEEPISYLVRFILCSIALDPEKYPELLAPVRVD